MDDRPEPDRIEIELTSNSHDRDRSSRRHRAERAPAGAQPSIAIEGPAEGDDPRPVGTGSDQRRLVVTATFVGVLALLLGWLIGRAGGSDEVATTAETTSTTALGTTQPTRTPLLPGETLPSAQVVTTVARVPRTTTSTTLAAPTVETVEVDPRLAGVELTLVGVEQQRVLVELDLAGETLSRRQLGNGSIEAGSMIVGDDWIALPHSQTGSSLVVHADGTTDVARLGEPWQLLWRTGTDHFWRPPTETRFDSATVYDEVDLAGEPTGVTLELPSGLWSWQADPNGGLVVGASGKNYSVGESSIDIIAPGELIGLSGDFAVTRDCDDQLRCGLLVTDRRTGTARTVDNAGGEADLMAVQGLWGWGGVSYGPISPDGTMIAVMIADGNQPALGLIDLTNGSVVELAQIAYEISIGWSPDGRFAFFVERSGGGGAVRAYDRRSDEVFPVVSKTLNWDVLAVRPAPS